MNSTYDIYATPKANLETEHTVGFFRKHLRGDYSLTRSFWVNGYLFMLLLQAPLLVAETFSSFSVGTAAHGAVVLISVVLLIAHNIWLAIGVDRCSAKRTDNLKPGLARLAVYLMLMLNMASGAVFIEAFISGFVESFYLSFYS